MQGTPLLTEKELFSVVGGCNAASITRKRNNLSLSNQAKFNSLSCSGATTTPKGIFDTNNFEMHKTQNGRSQRIGLLYESSRLNHSCKLNAYWTWNRMLNCHTIYAMAEIDKNDEITVSYLAAMCDTRGERNNKVYKKYEL